MFCETDVLFNPYTTWPLSHRTYGYYGMAILRLPNKKMLNKEIEIRLLYLHIHMSFKSLLLKITCVFHIFMHLYKYSAGFLLLVTFDSSRIFTPEILRE